ncbi:MAG: hypothetical protein HY655_12465, partial [Acidobacteria bacterium]|nr:hypothetical protein [Acidobacteriota bacterium]
MAYDSAWRPSDGHTLEVAGLLALTGVDQPRVTLAFEPDSVAVLRAVATTLAQLLAIAGLLGLALPRPIPSTDDAIAAFDRHVLTNTCLAFGRIPAHARFHLLYSSAVVLGLRWKPRDTDETSVITALLVPVTALVVARLSRSAWWYRGIGAMLLALAFFRTAMVGSLSPSALRDPPFWALLAIAAIAIRAAGRRWPAGVASASAIAGGCAMTAILISVAPSLEHPPGYAEMIQQSLGVL